MFSKTLTNPLSFVLPFSPNNAARGVHLILAGLATSMSCSCVLEKTGGSSYCFFYKSIPCPEEKSEDVLHTYVSCVLDTGGMDGPAIMDATPIGCQTHDHRLNCVTIIRGPHASNQFVRVIKLFDGLCNIARDTHQLTVSAGPYQSMSCSCD